MHRCLWWMRFDLSDEEWALFRTVDATKPQERLCRRPQGHERDFLGAAHGNAVARFAQTLRAIDGGLQPLQPLVRARDLEEDFPSFPAAVTPPRKPIAPSASIDGGTWSKTTSATPKIDAKSPPATTNSPETSWAPQPLSAHSIAIGSNCESRL
jgi:hypothetical protein